MSHPFRVAAAIAALIVVTACGPTAQAIHPTLQPPANGPAGTPVFPAEQSTAVFPPAPSTSSAALPVSSATPEGSPAPGIGQIITAFPSADAYEVIGVVPIGDGFLAVGDGPIAGQEDTGLDRGIVWTSTDGMTWQESSDPAFNGFTPTSVVTLGSDIYVVGDLYSCDLEEDPECDNGTDSTVVFRSSNGSGWDQLQQTADMQQAYVQAMVAANGLLVAWGSAADQDETLTLWTSSDGLTWTATTDLASMDEIDSATAGGPGLLAFGMKSDDQNDEDVLLGAYSSDGSHFSAGNVPNLPTGEIDDIAQGPGGYVGVGYSSTDADPTLGLILASPDGQTWTQATTSDNSFENAYVNEVHATPNGYVAIGAILDEDNPDVQTLRAWTSADGTSWHLAGPIGGPYTNYGASALGSHGLVVFTEYEDDSGTDDTTSSTSVSGWYVPIGSLAP